MSDSLIGTSLGQYHLQELIGRGGMASVYKATQETLGRFVAIKVLSRHDDPEFAIRFKAEARATAYLQHPHILPIYDYGEQNGLFYLVLQYVENSTTLDKLMGDAMPVAQVLPLMIRLLSALEYAHGRGVVHRDIKPGNVLLPAPDWPLLTDFGIAKLLDETGQKLTATGMIVGTPAYIAPEQATGHAVDARTDLYATGVILYEMLTGALPFTAETALALLLKHVHEAPPSPRMLNPGLPPELEPVMLRALAKRPEDRYQSAREMADDLGRIMAQVEPAYAMNRMAVLYQSGVKAFENQRWTDAITNLSQLQMLAPGYKDSADLLTAAQSALQRDQSSASQSTGAAPVAETQVAAARPASSSPAITVTLPHVGDEAQPPAVHKSRRNMVIIAAVALLALLGIGGLFAFGQRSGAAVAPTAAPAATTALAVVPPTQLAPTSTSVAAVAATVAPSPAPALAANGALTWGDMVLRNDVLTVTVDALPPAPAGQVYAVWLSSDKGSLALGTLSPDQDGKQTLSFASPIHQNLVADFDRVYITKVPESVATIEVANVIMVGSLPPQALVHIRHVLFSFDTTPNKIGFGLGLIQEVNEVVEHIHLLEQGMERGDLAEERVHAEHLVNIIEGAQGEHFGDLNGDGKPQNPGDGFGILQNGSQNGYVEGAKGHALLASEAADGSEDMKQIAKTIQDVGDNVAQRVTTIRDLALKINQAPNAEATRQDVEAIIKLAGETRDGVDANNNGVIEAVPGEGGALTLFAQAQQMAKISIVAGTVNEAAPPMAAPTAATVGTVINVQDNTYEPRKIAIAVGSTLVWNNVGQAAHTVSAEDKSFESGTVSTNGSFSHTFDQPGTFPYFCQFHGGPHGEGMSGTIIVSAKP